MLIKILKKMAFAPAIFMMIVIWGFSNSTADDSSSLSLEVTKTAVSIIQDCGVGQDWTQTYKTKLIEMIHTPVRKMAHMTEYAVLSICVVTALYINGLYGIKLKLFNQLICTTYAISDEIHQLFVKDRACRVLDVLIDSVGAFIGAMIAVAIIVKLSKWVKNKKQNEVDVVKR